MVAWVPNLPNASRTDSSSSTIKTIAFASAISAPKSDCIKLIHSNCHPEPFDCAQDKLREGSRRYILRCAKNDSSEGPHKKVYDFFAFRFIRPQTAKTARFRQPRPGVRPRAARRDSQ